jgi:hypothetical protein
LQKDIFVPNKKVMSFVGPTEIYQSSFALLQWFCSGAALLLQTFSAKWHKG